MIDSCCSEHSAGRPGGRGFRAVPWSGNVYEPCRTSPLRVTRLHPVRGARTERSDRNRGRTWSGYTAVGGPSIERRSGTNAKCWDMKRGSAAGDTAEALRERSPSRELFTPPCRASQARPTARPPLPLTLGIRSRTSAADRSTAGAHAAVDELSSPGPASLSAARIPCVTRRSHPGRVINYRNAATQRTIRTW
jgi:hypothetical protein